MRKNINSYMPLTSNIASIDLHGEDRKTAELLVRQFIDDNWRLKNKKLVVIHGIGTGILKKQVHEMLKKDKRVEKYYIDFFNVGCTLIELKENIDN